MNSVAQNVATVVVVDDYALGRRLFAQGSPDSACTTQEQARGWFDAAADAADAELAGLTAYLEAMAQDAHTDWDGVDGVVQAAVDTWYPRWL
jgi:hypothetical protein